MDQENWFTYWWGRNFSGQASWRTGGFGRTEKAKGLGMYQRGPGYARTSLFYLAGYLFPAGAGLMVAPDFVIRLLGSTGEYGTVLPRVVGLLLLGLGIIVAQLIRHEVEVLYPTTVAVRSLFLLGFAWFYWISRDRFFLAVFGIVAIGVVLTSTGLLLDRAFGGRRSVAMYR